MGDIIKIFSNIGSIYKEEEKYIHNKIYEYDLVKAYLCDLKTKEISPNFNIPKDDLIVCRFGVGANSGNLFPNIQYIRKAVNDDSAKFIKSLLRAIKNLLSCFAAKDIENSEILKALSGVDDNFFNEIIEDIKNLEEYKEKSKKTATFFALSWDGKPISAYFTEIFIKHISGDKNDDVKFYGYDILTNAKGIGGDANLAFCSVNELPDNLKSVKARLLPLNSVSANLVKIGFLAVDKELSFNFYGDKMAILPTLLSNDKNLFKEIIQILKESKNNTLQDIENTEENINFYLENTAAKQKDIPVLNTILFYRKSNSAVDVLLQIDDVLPSYISKISDAMNARNIKAFRRQDSKDNENTIYIQNLFDNAIEVMNFLLSQNKMNIDDMISKYSHLIYYGNMNKKYASRISWGVFFSGANKDRSMSAINKYQNLFNEIDVLNKKIILQKECDLQNLKDKKEIIATLIKNSEFLRSNSVLQSAYLLGMMSAALIARQYAISKGSSFEKWLNNSGTLRKELLERVYTKCIDTRKKLDSISGKSSAISAIEENLTQILPNAFLDDKVVKNSYITLAFAIGGSDFNKFVKEHKDKGDMQ